MPAQFRLDVTHLGGAIDLDAAKIVLSSDDADSFVAKLVPEGAAGAVLGGGRRTATTRLELHGGTGEQPGRHRAHVPARPRHVRRDLPA